MRKYLLQVAYEDGMSEPDEELFDDEESARRAFSEVDLAQMWRTEWMCLPTGGRGRLKQRRMAKELSAVEWDDGDWEAVGDPILFESHGYAEFEGEE